MNGHAKDPDLKFPDDVVLLILEGFTLIQAWRRHKRLSQEQLARLIGISQGSVSRIERSKNPDPYLLQKIATAMDIELEHLTL